MCRLAAYLGKPITVDELLFQPSNSLVKQSFHARETVETLNGDGFGIGWYAHEIDYTPAVYKSIQPAWNDRNLLSIAPKLRSNCMLAHVRAASAGGVSILNCHPFHYKRFLFMHNGNIDYFPKIKRDLRRALSNEAYDWIEGQTDSEHLCALFLDKFYQNKYEHTAVDMRTAFLDALQMVLDYQKTLKIADAGASVNVVISDGLSMIASRICHNVDYDCPTLYYSAGSQYEFHDGVCHMRPAGEDGNEAIIVVSEKLTQFTAEWHEIPINHILLIHQDLSLTLEPVKLV